MLTSNPHTGFVCSDCGRTALAVKSYCPAVGCHVNLCRHCLADAAAAVAVLEGRYEAFDALKGYAPDRPHVVGG